MGETGIINEYRVTGMVCQHCVSAVPQEIATLDGVTDVRVDLTTGRVTVASTRPLDETVVRAANAEAGYEMSA